MLRGRHLLWVLSLLTASVAAPAYAGTVYRCESPDGSRTYASKRVPGAKCTVVSTYTPPSRAARTPAPTELSRVSTETVVSPPPASGAAMPASPVAGSPVAVSASTVSQTLPNTTQAAPAAGSAMPTRRLVQGQVYSYIKDGVRNYTSKPPKGVAGVTGVRTIRYSFMETCFACALQPGVNFKTLRLNVAAYDAEIRAAARQHGVEEAIVRAIIHAESSFNPNALSRVGAQGLMQLMPATARRFGVNNAFDPGQNINGGVQYLAWLLKRYNGDLALAAASYNAGEGAVDRYGGVPPYSETKRYVERVRILAERYRGMIAGRG